MEGFEMDYQKAMECGASLEELLAMAEKEGE